MSQGVRHNLAIYLAVAYFSTPLRVIVIEQIFVDHMCLEFKWNVHWKISPNLFIIIKAVYVQGMHKESNLISDLLQLPYGNLKVLLLPCPKMLPLPQSTLGQAESRI